MAMANIRFNLIEPSGDPADWSQRYQAMLAMAAYADANGFFGVSLEEHHGATNGWSPTPLLNAGMILSRTEKLSVSISALLLPLHDPVRIAEDIAVLDLSFPGRLVTIVGIGYRPEEYALHDKSWADRGKLMDHCLETLLRAWSGEPFEYNGATVTVTPVPVTRPHPMLLVGGTSKIAARRAARLGLPMFLAAHMPELEAYYYEQCAERETQGFLMMPPADTAMTHVSEDPDRTWADHGHHFLHEAETYASWQTPDIHSAVHSRADSVQALRDEGIYQVLTPEECLAKAEASGSAAFTLHPLCGGMPVEEGWKSVRLFAEQVLPHLA